MFAGKDIPAVGFAFGFDRVMEAMDNLNLFPKNLNGKNVFVAFSNSDLQKKALEVASKIRDNNLNVEIYLEDETLEKQLKYADKKQIRNCVIVEGNNLIFKDMEKRTQENFTIDEIIKKLK
jgi:histidyl-tRNA synthetase